MQFMTLPKNIIAVVCATAFLILVPQNANAEPDRAALEKRVAELEAKLKKFETMFEQADHKIDSRPEGSKAQNMMPKQNSGLKIGPGLKVKSADGHNSIQVIGRLQGDFVHFDDDLVDHPTGTTIRRARLGIKGRLHRDWIYKFETDFADDQTDITDAYLGYDGLEFVSFKAGQFKEPIGMDKLTSSGDYKFLERAAAANKLVPGRKIGLAAFYSGDYFRAQGGVFGDEAGTSSSDDEQFSVTGRLVTNPIHNEKSSFHVGLSGSYRTPDDADRQVRFSSRADNNVQDQNSVSVTVSDVDHYSIYGLELAGHHKNLMFQSEYLRTDLKRDNGIDPSFDGYYLQVAWALTGETYRYNTAQGVYKRVKPQVNFDWRKGVWGAFELAARYSTLDLNDSQISGGELKTLTLGFNWYPNNNVRFIGNYIMADTNESAPVNADSPDIYGLRAQFDF